MGLNIWRCLFAGLLFLPALPFMYWPSDIEFYILVLVDGIINAYALSIIFDLAAKKSARVSFMYLPFEALAIFIGWYIIHPENLTHFTNQPVQSWGALACLILTILGLNSIKNNQAEWNNLKIVAPIGLTFGLFSLANRWVFDTHDIPRLEGSLTFTYLSFLVAVPLLLPVFIANKKHAWKSELLAQPLIKGGLLTGLLSGLFYIFYVWAVMSAPNPAYPGVIAMTLPVLLYIYNRIRKVPEHINLFGLVLLLLGAGGLRLFSG